MSNCETRSSDHGHDDDHQQMPDMPDQDDVTNELVLGLFSVSQKQTLKNVQDIQRTYENDTPHVLKAKYQSSSSSDCAKGKQLPENVESLSTLPVDQDEKCLKFCHDEDNLQDLCTCMDNYLLKTLDEMERKIEKLRETVREAETERLHLLESLNTLMQSQALVAAGMVDK